ncbi:MAG: hypothetical protein KGM16_12385 [Bacteroidota bacterium]|nr:hypothetical protein [Bacteroidota bacterium]
MRNIFSCVLFLVIPFHTIAQKRLLQFLESDTNYTLIKGLKPENKIIQLPKELNCGQAFHHYIVKSGILYVQVDGSGKLFKIDSTLRPVRIDNTCYEGYNFGAYNFTATNRFYSFGGWGFWEYNGALRFFDNKAKEWFVTDLNKDVPFSIFLNGIVYNDFKDHLLYLIYKPTPNTYIKSDDKETNDTLSVQCLNLKTFKFWANPRKLVNGLINYSLPGNPNILNMSTSKGLLVATQNGFGLLDFKNEKVYSFNNEAAEKFQSQSKPQYFLISRDSSLYFYNPVNDSVEHARFSFKDFKLTNAKLFYEVPKPDRFSVASLIYWSIIFLLIAFLILIYYNQRNKIKKLNSQLVKKNGNNGIKNKDINFGINSSFPGILTEQERFVFELILKNSKNNRFTTIDELNILLGVKSKESYIQNKVRSDSLQSINQKFTVFASTVDELIERERTDFDKRYYHYKINKRYMNRL